MVTNYWLGIGASIAAALLPSTASAQDAPPKEKKPEAVQSQPAVEKAVVDGIPFVRAGDSIYKPAQYYDSHATLRGMTGKDEFGLQGDGRYRLDSIDVALGGFTQKSKPRTLDPGQADALGEVDTLTFDKTAKSRGIILSADAFDTLLWLNYHALSLEGSIDGYSVLQDDPSVPIFQDHREVHSNDEDAVRKALRLGHAFGPVSVTIGGFTYDSSGDGSIVLTDTLSGIINTTITETYLTTKKERSRGYTGAIDWEAVTDLAIGIEGWSVSGTRESSFNGTPDPDLDLGYTQFLGRFRSRLLGIGVQAEVGQRRWRDSTLDDALILGGDVTIPLGDVFVAFTGGKDPYDNSFGGGYIGLSLGDDRAANLASMMQLMRTVRNARFYRDPTLSETQQVAANIEGLEATARRFGSGFIVGLVSCENDTERVHLAQVGVGFGHGFLLEGGAELREDSKLQRQYGMLHWSLRPLLNVPAHVGVGYARTKNDGSSEKSDSYLFELGWDF